jgi:hypothetical protein
MSNWLKKKILTRWIIRNKKKHKFDVKVADDMPLLKAAPNGYNDSRYFLGLNLSGKESVFFRFARRGDDEKNEIWFTIITKDGKRYAAEHDYAPKNKKSPASVEILKAGEVLKFNYNGKVKSLDEDGEILSCKFSGTFVSSGDAFEFSRDLDTSPLVNAFIDEPLKNFKEFKKIRECHYEQSGLVSCDFEIDGEEHRFENIAGLRDHSFGPRNYDDMDRYIKNIILLPKNKVLHASFVKNSFVKNLNMGYYQDENGEISSLVSANRIADMPCEGTTPKAYTYIAHFANGETKNISVKCDQVFPYYFAGDFNVNEGIAEFNVNGEKGRGIAEFGFAKDKARWTK